MSHFRFVFHFLAFVAIFIFDGSRFAAAQNLREEAREHYRLHPDVPFQPGLLSEYWPKTLEELTREAHVVLLARLSRIGSYLTANEKDILTDYSIQEAHVIAGRMPVLLTQAPGQVAPMILTVYGGEVTVDGLLIRLKDHNRWEAIQDGRQYLLFLRQSRPPEAGRYEISHGGVFEVLEEKVRPLLQQGGDLFKDVAGASLQDLTPRIQKAAPTP